MRSLTSILEEKGAVTAAEASELGVARTTLSRMVMEGALVRLGTGLYAAPDREFDAHLKVAMQASILKEKGGALALVSAAIHHQISTANISRIWVAVPVKGGSATVPRPRTDMPLQVVKWSQSRMVPGYDLDDVSHSGREFFVTTKERTVVDMLRYANAVGSDVAEECLAMALESGDVDADDLMTRAYILGCEDKVEPALEKAGALRGRLMGMGW